MKQSESSAREGRTPARRNGISGGIEVRHVKFTAEEMAYDAPSDVSDPRLFPKIARGRREWEEFLSFRRGYVRIDPELREYFKDDEAVNRALRKLVEVKPRRRKTA